MAKFNVIQKKKRAQIAERKRAIHGDPSSRKLKVKPQNQSVSRKRKHCTVIPETPMSDIAILKCSSGKASFDFHAKVSDQNNKFSGMFCYSFIESEYISFFIFKCLLKCLFEGLLCRSIYSHS
ncbi:hypothetical protein CsatB_007011 [Cannabis sativa]